MATAPTLTGPIGTRQINRNFYVGLADLTTIQQAVTAAVAIGNGCVVIPIGYAGSDTIAAVSGGSATVYISDQRTASPQNYSWSGTQYLPADFVQLGDIEAQNGYFSETLTVEGDAVISGEITAGTAALAVALVDNSPVRTFANTPDFGPGDGMIWPPIGISVSTGSAWAASINPATLTPYPGAGIPVSTGSAWGTPITPASLATWPAAGIAVSTGTAWGTPIPTADVALLSASLSSFAGGANFGGTIVARVLQVVDTTEVGSVGLGWFLQPNMAAGNTSGVFVGQSNSPFNLIQLSLGYAGAGSASNFGVIGFVGGAGATFDNSGNWHIPGTVTAAGKSFNIQHPLDPTKRLVHGCIEAPEWGVYYRGEGATTGGWAEVMLPDYFESLVREENRSVLLTPLFEHDAEQIGILAASRVKDGKFKVWSQLPAQKFYWEVKGVRADLEPLEVEPEKPAEEPTHE